MSGDRSLLLNVIVL